MDSCRLKNHFCFGTSDKSFREINRSLCEIDKDSREIDKSLRDINRGFREINKGLRDINKGSLAMNKSLREIGFGSRKTRARFYSFAPWLLAISIQCSDKPLASAPMA